MSSGPVSAQLELALGDVRRRIPWDGIRPRELTKGRKSLFFRREPGKNDRFFADVRQIDMFPAATRMPHLYDGAPLLL